VHSSVDDGHRAVLDVLQSRQNGEGAFGSWQASVDVDPFISAYAVLYLLEARDRGVAVPAEVLQRANAYLRTVAADESFDSLDGLRKRAFAIYLLTRQGEVTSNALLSARQQLDADYLNRWSDDSTAVLLAASYAGLKQDDAAKPLLVGSLERLGRAHDPRMAWAYDQWYDPLIADALALYLLHKHFPSAARALPDSVLERLVQPIAQGRYNTLSAALSVLALEAYAVSNPSAAAIEMYGVRVDGSEQRLLASAGLVQRADYADADRTLKLDRGDVATSVWYMRSERGFERQLPAAANAQGIEIQREYLDERGMVVSAATLGQELTVRLRLRSVDGAPHANIAIMDLLPGGFEIVEPQPDADGQLLPLVQSSDLIEHHDAREDRLLIYTQASESMADYRYRIKATAAGSFVIPPAYAESMYELAVRSNGAPVGRIEVVRP
jgi:hypothetical protein